MTPGRLARGLVVAAAAVVLLAAGALGMYVYLRPSAPSNAAATAVPTAAPAASGGEAITLNLTPEAVARAGLRTAEARVGPLGSRLTVPGIVEPHAYRQALVSTLAAGQVRSVSAELGAMVRAGEPLATIHSLEVAEAERVYVSMNAELVAAHQRVARLEALVKIGAASRQELEAAQADHTTHATDVEGARARLMLLGVSADDVRGLVDASRINPMLTITAPSAGVITRRAVNRGQNVAASEELFTIVDLTTVWVVGNVYERDLARVRVGGRATMTSAVQPGLTWRGTVTYLDPQVAAETRTARVRVEVANPDLRLKLGMFLDLVIHEASAAPVLLVPRSAVHTIGGQAVVYVADAPGSGRVTELPVRLGSTSGREVEIVAGLSPGQLVVTEGGFFLRAERDRLGLPAPGPAPGGAPSDAPETVPPKRIAIEVSSRGFAPDRIDASRGVPLDLVFTRTTDETCAKEVLVPSRNVKQALPLNTPVTIRITPAASGEVAFACGMNMFKGTVVVR
jgi:RND family efflux transporter MFP subunit